MRSSKIDVEKVKFENTARENSLSSSSMSPFSCRNSLKTECTIIDRASVDFKNRNDSIMNSAIRQNIPDDRPRRVCLNIGGTRFETYSSTLKRIPNSRLAELSINDDNYDHERDEFFSIVQRIFLRIF